MKDVSISEIKALISEAGEEELASLERSLAGDPRKGVRVALAQARKRLDRQKAESDRLDNLYSYERELCGSKDAVCVGLDEVGRGPIAGPLAVGGCVLPASPKISGLNDSKRIPEDKRDVISQKIIDVAIAQTVVFVEPSKIDEIGISSCLRYAFLKAIENIESKIGHIDVVFLDGNPMHLDPRETNVIKGDSKCASISAASILAKVARDSYMRDISSDYPQYDFAENKGYGTASHIEAVKQYGISNMHRKSFCSAMMQETLF